MVKLLYYHLISCWRQHKHANHTAQLFVQPPRCRLSFSQRRFLISSYSLVKCCSKLQFSFSRWFIFHLRQIWCNQLFVNLCMYVVAFCVCLVVIKCMCYCMCSSPWSAKNSIAELLNLILKFNLIKSAAFLYIAIFTTLCIKQITKNLCMKLWS